MSFTKAQKDKYPYLEKLTAEQTELVKANIEHPQVIKVLEAAPNATEDMVTAWFNQLARTLDFNARAVEEADPMDMFTETVKVHTARATLYNPEINGVYTVNKETLLTQFGVNNPQDLVGTKITWKPARNSSSKKYQSMYIIDIEGLDSAKVANTLARVEAVEFNEVFDNRRRRRAEITARTSGQTTAPADEFGEL